MINKNKIYSDGDLMPYNPYYKIAQLQKYKLQVLASTRLNYQITNSTQWLNQKIPTNNPF